MTSAQRAGGYKVRGPYHSATGPVSAPRWPPLLRRTQTCIRAHILRHVCPCSHGCSGSRGWCITACKAELSVTFNSLSQRSNRTCSRAGRIRPLTASATLYKSSSGSTSADSAEHKTTARPLWSSLTDTLAHASRCPRVRTQIWGVAPSFSQSHELISNTEQLWHLWRCTEWEPVQKACHRSKKLEDTCSLVSGSQTASVCSLLGQRQSVWDSGLKKLLWLLLSVGEPTGGQQLAHQSPSGLVQTHSSVHIHRAVKTWLIICHEIHFLSSSCV